jgi:pimeloyl-ACP methyl ester carboxylesterase
MGGVRSRRLGGLLFAGALVALLAVERASAAVPIKFCPTPASTALQCLRVSVPLDRSKVLPGTIRLRVRIAPPDRGIVKGTILALAGGPGQAGASQLELFESALPPSALRFNQLAAFDQRGTGRSGRLRCPELAPLSEGGALPQDDVVQDAVAACASRLGPARAHYATADSVEDVETVRNALGADKLVLYGTSYGTKVALDYAAAHPEHVSRLVLDSVVPPEGVDPFERATLAAIPQAMRALCARRSCPFTRDAGADVATLAQRLARGPIRGSVVDRHGHPRPALLASRDLFTVLLVGDVVPVQRALVPAAVRSALDGDPALLLRLAATPVAALDEGGGDSLALYLANTCEDSGVPWAAGTPIADRSAAVAAAVAAIPVKQLAPFGPAAVRDLGFADLCRAWPESPIAQPHLPLPNVPTLILSGEQDLRTPRGSALALAARIPGAQVVTVPQTGHSTLGADDGDCAGDAVAAFVAGRSPRGCRPGRPDVLTAPAGVPPRSLRAVQPIPGMRPHSGRTVAAVMQTIVLMDRVVFVELLSGLVPDDVEATRAFRLGGLRGGNVTLTRRGIALRRYSAVPGVELSGRLSDGADDPGVVRVSGRAAASGWLRIGERWTVGRLAGRRVRVRSRLLLQRATRAAVARAVRSGPVAQPLPPVTIPVALRALLG